MNKLKVAIPLKTNSDRVPNKNLRPFVGEDSLFDIKAKQLLRCVAPEDVFVSSENLEAKPIVEKYGFNFLHRDIALTPNSAPWSDVIKNIVTAIDDTSDIFWVQVVQPLFDEFEQVLRKWNEVYDKHDSLAVVQRLHHHLLDANGHPVNFNFGYWHKVSQDLPPVYQVTWAAFCMKREMLNQCWYNIGKNPFLYETDAPLIDIDYPVDFEIAQYIYRHRNLPPPGNIA